MPRRHSYPKHIPFQMTNSDKSKKRYPSESAAQKAAEIIMLQNPSTELSVYRGSDGGWYLTSKTHQSR